jgi:STE24 endopeptidase
MNPLRAPEGSDFRAQEDATIRVMQGEWMRSGRVVWVVAAMLATLGVFWFARQSMAPTATEARAMQIAAQDHAPYTLRPEKLERANALDQAERRLVVVAEIWGVLQLVLILATGVVARIRDAAMRLSANRWVQGFAFVFLVLAALHVLNLPLGIYAHRTGLAYGLSVQGWGSWLADRGKMLMVEWVVGGLLAMLVSAVMRRSPARWWLLFWPMAAASVLAGAFITPYVIDPLFNHFEPLANSDPALVQRLEQVVARAGATIPRERMFLMRASAKSTQLNAYVTGFGASKRVVVWDTTVTKSTPDEIAFIFAHEMGHYALGHIALGLGLSCLSLLPGLWLAHRGVQILLARFGGAWRIASQEDWGALVVLALVLMTLSALGTPGAAYVSRWVEHNADVYGQEAVHGVVSDPQRVGQEAFQLLGEDSLDDPTPHPLYDWWFDSHPPIQFRAAFARAYDPWAAGEHPRYFQR